MYVLHKDTIIIVTNEQRLESFPDAKVLSVRDPRKVDLKTIDAVEDWFIGKALYSGCDFSIEGDYFVIAMFHRILKIEIGHHDFLVNDDTMYIVSR